MTSQKLTTFRTPSRGTHSHYHLFKSTTSKPFKSSLFGSTTRSTGSQVSHSSTTRPHYHQHSVRTSSSIVVWTTPKSYFFQKRPAAVTHKYVQATEPTKVPKKTNFLSTLWRKESGRATSGAHQSETHQSTGDSGQTLPVYSGNGIDDSAKERRPKPL